MQEGTIDAKSETCPMLELYCGVQCYIGTPVAAVSPGTRPLVAAAAETHSPCAELELHQGLVEARPPDICKSTQHATLITADGTC